MKHRGDLTDEEIALAVIHDDGDLHYRVCCVERLTGHHRHYILRVVDEYHARKEREKKSHNDK